jgi:hypothetical protein
MRIAGPSAFTLYFVKLLPKRKSSDSPDAPDLDDATGDGQRGKGRPTPKRREVAPTRGPVTAPKNRKEAYARQKQLNRETRAASGTARSNGAPQTPAEKRAAMRSGAILSARDQGPTRKLARDYVDSRRLFSNYLLFVMVLMLASMFARHLAILQLIALALFIGCVFESVVLGMRIRKLAVARFGKADVGTASIAFYALSRAYLPRRWRMPAPQVELGDEI